MSRWSSKVRAVAWEFEVVFVGVLFALAADSQWEAREDRLRLRSNLEALAAEMDQTATGLERAIQANSANVALFREIHDGLLAGNAASFSGLASLPVTFIVISPIPRGTLQGLINGGDVRLIESVEHRTALVGGLSSIELQQGWMDDLATEGRRAMEPIYRASDASAAAGRPWPDSAVGDVDVLAALTLLSQRLDNNVRLHRSGLVIAEGLRTAALEAVEELQ